MSIKDDIAALCRGELDLDAVKDRVREHIAHSDNTAVDVLQTLHASRESGELQEETYEDLTHFVNSTVLPAQDAVSGEEDEDDSSYTRLADVPFTGGSSLGGGNDKPVDVVIGMRLRDRFILDEIVGVGGMGTVYRGRDSLKIEARDRDPHVAIKVLNENFKQRPESFVALQREASRQQRLAHPNIATVYDFDRSEGVVFITMEFLSGQTLEDFIKEEVIANDGLDMERVFPLLEDICAALSYAHERNIVHADFKPGNCFVTENGRVKVLDFGIARAMKDPHAPVGDHTLFDPRSIGALTPAYASLEMLHDSEEADPRDDIYALGCVTYELLTGRHPFHRIPADQAKANDLKPPRIKKLSSKQNEALANALSFDRATRTPTANDFLEGMRGSQGGLMKGNGKLFAAIAALLVVGLLAFALPNLLDERNYQQVVEKLRSEDREIVAVGLTELTQLQPTFVRRGLLENRTSLLTYFRDEVNSLLGVPDEVVDYARIDQILDRAISNFPDSMILTELNASYQKRKDAYVSDLARMFESYLSLEYLLPRPEDDDLHDLLARIAIVDATSPLLSDSRIPGAYVDAGNSALVAEDYSTARQLIDAGLSLTPGASSLADLNDRLTSIEQAQQLEQEIAAAARNLTDGAGDVSSMSELKNLAELYATLKQLDPVHPVLKEAGEAMAARFAQEIEEVLNAPALVRTTQFLEQFESAWTSIDQPAIPNDIRQRRQFLQAQQDELVTMARIAVSNPSLELDNGDSLASLLERMSEIDADDGRIADLYSEAVAELQRRSRALADAGNWDGARAVLASAEAFAPTDALQTALADAARRIDSLEVEARNRIALAERQEALDREAAARQAQAERLAAQQRAHAEEVARAQRAVTDALAEVSRNEPIASMQTVRSRIQALSRLDADNAMLEDARADLRSAVVVAISGQPSVEQALPLIAQAKQELGAYPALNQLEQNLVTRQQAELAAARQQRIEAAIASLDNALNDLAKLDTRSGRRNAASALSRLRQLPQVQDTDVSSAVDRFARAHANAALTLVEAQRFSAAQEILDAASAEAPGNPNILRTQKQLTDLQVAFQEQRAAREKQAKLAALEDRFRREVAAEQLDRALASLTELDEFDATSDFAQSGAKQMLVDAYARQIVRRTRDSQLTKASQLLAQGRALEANDRRWDDLQREIDITRSELRVNSWFTGTSRQSVGTIRQYLTQLQQARESEYPSMTERWARAGIARLSELSGDRSKHNRFLADAQSLLPEQPALAAAVPLVPAPVPPPILSSPSPVKSAERPAAEPTPEKQAVPDQLASRTEPTRSERATEQASPVPPADVVQSAQVARLSLADIAGQWCAEQLKLEFSADTMVFMINRRRLDYPVTNYEFEQNLIRVSWRDRRVGMVFEFGEFSNDGSNMTQIRGRRADSEDWQAYDRTMRRCP